MKKRQRTQGQLALLFAIALSAVLAGCGGGGGGGGTPVTSFPARETTATVTGTIDSITADAGYVGRAAEPAAGKEAGRTASAIVITDFSDFTVIIGGVAGTITGTTYTVMKVPAGRNLLIKISKGKLVLKAYLPEVEAGKSPTPKKVNIKSTAAAIVWEELGKPEDTSVENLEKEYDDNPATARIRTVVENLDTAIKDPAAADALGDGETLLDAPDVKEAVTEAKLAEDTTGPTISAVFPNGSITTLDTTMTRIKLQFNEAMTTATPTGISVDVKNTTTDAATTTVAAPTLSWSDDTKVLVVDHGVALEGSSDYTLVLTLNPAVIKDAAGNALSLPSSISGATVDSTAKTITVKFTTTFAVTPFVEVAPTEHTADEIGAADKTFVMTFFGGATIAGSGAAYVGAAECAACHSTLSTSYAETNHATAFDRKKDTLRPTCIACHSIDGPRIPDWSAGGTKPVRSNDNGAFGLAATVYAATSTVPVAMQSIQCENCHGPASLHVAGGGDKNFIVAGKQAHAVSTCDVCHDSPTHHAFSQNWRKSGHAVTNFEQDSKTCAPCHSGEGFVEFTKRHEEDPTVTTITSGVAAAITVPTTMNVNCTTCHDPHQATEANDPQLRLPKEDICLACHSGRKRGPGEASTRTPPYSTPHRNIQGRVFNGEMGVTSDDYMYMENPADPVIGTAYIGRTISAFGSSMGSSITCTDCHMHAEEGHGENHTFKPNPLACGECHTGMDGAAAIGYKQALFKSRYDPVKAREQLAKADLATFTDEQKKTYAIAKWNLELVDYDGSKGVHNTPYVSHLIDEASDLLTSLGY